MARSEYRRCPPRLPLRRGVQAAIAIRGQPHRHIAAANEGLIVGRPVRNAVLRLIRGMDLRLHPCSVDPAEDHEKCGPNRPTAESSCNNAGPNCADGIGRNSFRDAEVGRAPPAEPLTAPICQDRCTGGFGAATPRRRCGRVRRSVAKTLARDSVSVPPTDRRRPSARRPLASRTAPDSGPGAGARLGCGRRSRPALSTR